MGNGIQIKKKEIPEKGVKFKNDDNLLKIQKLIYKSYKKIRIKFSEKDLIGYKMRLNDCENYFYTEFNHLLIFDNEFFYYNVNKLYDNYSTSVEEFSKENKIDNNNIFRILVLILDETELLVDPKEKIEFDTLFTIIFEKIEINLALYIDFSNAQFLYARTFFEQLCENTYLYKCNRKFDCLYILLPSIDYIFKNLNTLTFISNRNLNIKDCNQIIDAIFNVKHFKKFLLANYNFIYANNVYKVFLEKNNPLISISFYYFDFNQSNNPNNFLYLNKYQITLIENLISFSLNNIILIYINDNFTFDDNFIVLINNILNCISNKQHNRYYMKIKFLFVNSTNNLCTNNNNELDDINFIGLNLCNKVHEIIYNFFKDNEKNIKKINFILEFYEIKGNKTKLMKFNITYLKYNFCKNELITNSYLNEKIKISNEMIYASKIFKIFYPWIYQNDKIMNLIHEFVDEKKLKVTNKIIFEKNNDNKFFYEKGLIEGFSNKKEFKKNFYIFN